jgi:hypothetical protein
VTPHYAANKSLRWVCLGCGQNWKVEMPGFPGSTIGGHHWHVFDQERGVNCDGPIVARIVEVAA